jgi:hypothetical protein
MSAFSDEVKERRQQRRSNKKTGWEALIKNLMLLVAVLAVIHFLGSPKGGLLTKYVFGKPKTEAVQQGEP